MLNDVLDQATDAWWQWEWFPGLLGTEPLCVLQVPEENIQSVIGALRTKSTTTQWRNLEENSRFHLFKRYHVQKCQEFIDGLLWRAQRRVRRVRRVRREVSGEWRRVTDAFVTGSVPPSALCPPELPALFVFSCLVCFLPTLRAPFCISSIWRGQRM